LRQKGLNHTIPFNKPYVVQKSIDAFTKSAYSGSLVGDGPFSLQAQEWLIQKIGSTDALLTTSCTQALEFATLLGNFQPGDEVIIPSFTFTSAATALVNFDLTPVFVDINVDDLNISCAEIEKSITPKTRAISALNYNGVAANWAWLRSIADENGLFLIEDNAHGLGVTSEFGNLGNLGDVATLSFHGTKNFQCGEGGALVLNDTVLNKRASILREKGTNRRDFLKGSIEKYEWVDKGGSYLLSDLLSAFLLGQFQDFDHIQNSRQLIWKFYHDQLAQEFHSMGWKIQSHPGNDSQISGHIFYMIAPTRSLRDALLDYLSSNGIQATFHYQALHDSPAGRNYGKSIGDYQQTDIASNQLIRLPLYPDLSRQDMEFITEKCLHFLKTSVARI
jgi:dTDP-4-amino-4,6-dideoxygalactose transaminase